MSALRARKAARDSESGDRLAATAEQPGQVKEQEQEQAFAGSPEKVPTPIRKRLTVDRKKVEARNKKRPTVTGGTLMPLHRRLAVDRECFIENKAQRSEPFR